MKNKRFYLGPPKCNKRHVDECTCPNIFCLCCKGEWRLSFVALKDAERLREDKDGVFFTVCDECVEKELKD